MTDKLLKKYAVDIFFGAIILLLLISIVFSFNYIDIVYFCCVIYYYVKIRLYRWKKCL